MSDNTSNLLSGAISNLFNNAINATRNNGDAPAAIRALLNILFILLLVGAQGMKVIFRKNISKHQIHFPSIAICIACFVVISYSSIHDIIDGGNPLSSINWIYGFLAIYILIKAIIAFTKTGEPDLNNEGDSLFSFLEAYGYSENLIKYFVEPFYVLFIGTLLWCYNSQSGYPLIFCAFSMWIYALIDWVLNRNSADSMKSRMQSKQQKGNSNQSIAN